MRGRRRVAPGMTIHLFGQALPVRGDADGTVTRTGSPSLSRDTCSRGSAVIVTIGCLAVLGGTAAGEEPNVRNTVLKPLVTNLHCHKPVTDQAFQAALEKVREDPIVRAEILTIYAGCLLRSPQKLQRAADAVPLLKEAHNILPERATLLRLLGEAHFLLWQHDEAVATLEAALKITPDARTAHSLGLALFRSVAGPEGLTDLEHRKQVLLVAERHLRTAIDLAPDNPSHHDTLGMVLDTQGRRDEAVAEKLKAIELHSSFTGYQSEAARTFALADYYLSLGQTYLHMPGRREEGEQMIQKSINAAPPGRAREHITQLGHLALHPMTVEQAKAFQEQAKREAYFDPFEEEAAR